MIKGIALDATARTFDTDGRMHINRSHISKAGVNPYYGREIPGYQDLGLNPDKVYKLFRDPEELKKAAHTFARNPILRRHVPVTAAEPATEDIIGTIGTDVEFNDPYLDADLAFWDQEAITGIENDTLRELSSAYHYLPVMISGVYKGENYDGIMTQIRGNHLATVEAGRAGSDVLAADSQLREPMKKTKLGNALFVALSAVSSKLAMDAALLPLVGAVTKKTFNRADVRAKVLAMDADADESKVDAVMDAVMECDEPGEKPNKATKAAADKAAKDAAAKAAEDAKEDDEDDEDDDEETKAEKKKRREAKAKEAAKDEEKVKGAMDAMSAKLRQEFRDIDEAKRLVRPVVGDVIAQDSAEEIYGFALDQMKVDRAGVEGVPALRALYNLASKPTSPAVVSIAQDSKGLVAKFPNASRFRQA